MDYGIGDDLFQSEDAGRMRKAKPGMVMEEPHNDRPYRRFWHLPHNAPHPAFPLLGRAPLPCGGQGSWKREERSNVGQTRKIAASRL